MNEFDNKYNIVDDKLPSNAVMVGRYKQCFAYYTLRERLPVILTQVIDNLSKDKELIAGEFSKDQDANSELKKILGELSKLKYELQTDKKISEFKTKDVDFKLWNDFINSLPEDSNTYFSACWLYSECYMYRKIRFFFEESKLLNNYDYFKKQKEDALTGWVDVLEIVTNKIRNEEMANKKLFFHKLLKLNLWGNRCDLSLSNGKEVKQNGDQFSKLDELNEYILIDHSDDIWNCISMPYSGDRIIDFINDNSGYELFTDLLLAEFLIEQKLATKIRFNVKAMPWYVSDVTPNDFIWTCNYLGTHQSTILSELGKKWLSYVDKGQFELTSVDYFWTSPYEFYRMKEIAPDLYNKLGEAHLIIFKGDLNYRKLIGDFTWDPTTKFEICLRGFHPSNLCTLRTIKADLICGLENGISEKLFIEEPSWMVTGKYGLIKFCKKLQ